MKIPFRFLAGVALLVPAVFCEPKANPYELKMYYNIFKVMRLIKGEADTTMAKNVVANTHTLRDFVMATHDMKNYGPSNPMYPRGFTPPLFPAFDFGEDTPNAQLERYLFRYRYDPTKLFPGSVVNGAWPTHQSLIRKLFRELNRVQATATAAQRAAVDRLIDEIQFNAASAMRERMIVQMNKSYVETFTNRLRALGAPDDFTVVEKRDVLYENGDRRVLGRALDLEATITKFHEHVEERPGNNPQFIRDYYNQLFSDASTEVEIKNHQPIINSYQRSLESLPGNTCRIT